jgi:hypothetical protein
LADSAPLIVRGDDEDLVILIQVITERYQTGGGDSVVVGDQDFHAANKE